MRGRRGGLVFRNSFSESQAFAKHVRTAPGSRRRRSHCQSHRAQFAGCGTPPARLGQPLADVSEVDARNATAYFANLRERPPVGLHPSPSDAPSFVRKTRSILRALSGKTRFGEVAIWTGLVGGDEYSAVVFGGGAGGQGPSSDCELGLGGNQHILSICNWIVSELRQGVSIHGRVAPAVAKIIVRQPAKADAEAIIQNGWFAVDVDNDGEKRIIVAEDSAGQTLADEPALSPGTSSTGPSGWTA